MARTFTLYETGKITEEEFVKRRSELLELETNIRQTIFDKNTELQKLRERQINRETFKRALAILTDQFEQHTTLEKKAALSMIVEQINVKSGTFRVYFRHTQTAAD